MERAQYITNEKWSSNHFQEHIEGSSNRRHISSSSWLSSHSWSVVWCVKDHSDNRILLQQTRQERHPEEYFYELNRLTNNCVVEEKATPSSRYSEANVSAFLEILNMLILCWFYGLCYIYLMFTSELEPIKIHSTVVTWCCHSLMVKNLMLMIVL